MERKGRQSVAPAVAAPRHREPVGVAVRLQPVDLDRKERPEHPPSRLGALHPIRIKVVSPEKISEEIRRIGPRHEHAERYQAAADPIP
jgi:hypothetical protein